MKSNHLKKIVLNLTIALLANFAVYAQGCIHSTSYDISEINNNGDGSCDYLIDLCAVVQGSPRPKRIVYTVSFDKNEDGNMDNQLTYEFDPPGNHISNGSYCLSSMSGDESFVITIPCQAEVSVSIIGYKSNSGNNNSSCVGLSENVSTATLPVELVEFKAIAINDEIVLNWTTASEIDHDYFAIERSSDSRVFTTIGERYSEEDSYGLRYYSFTDTDPRGGENFYRLRQVDLNGHTDFSEIRAVKFASTQNYLLYPSLAREKITVDFGQQLETNLSIRVIDMSGKLIKKTEVGRGDKEVVIETNEFVNGAYFVTFEGDRVALKTGRFVKVS